MASEPCEPIAVCTPVYMIIPNNKSGTVGNLREVVLPRPGELGVGELVDEHVGLDQPATQRTEVLRPRASVFYRPETAGESWEPSVCR